MKGIFGYFMIGLGLEVFKAVENFWLLAVSFLLFGIGLHWIVDERVEEAKQKVMEEIEELEK